MYLLARGRLSGLIRRIVTYMVIAVLADIVKILF